MRVVFNSLLHFNKFSNRNVTALINTISVSLSKFESEILLHTVELGYRAIFQGE